MKQTIGVELECLLNVPNEKRLELIKEAGFDAVFSNQNQLSDILAMKEKATKLGLAVEFLHAPFAGINTMWEPGLGYLGIQKGMRASIDSAAAADIPVVVAHISSGWWAPQLCDIGLERFDRLVEYAGEKGVKIAFENIRKPGNLAALMERYEKIDHVGYCYDCGHEHCYTVTVPFIELYGSRLLCTHIHDNFGRNKDDWWGDPDSHLMPFDGEIDYADVMRRLRKAEYTGTLTLEMEKKGDYASLDDRDFLHTAYERMVKIANL